MLALDFARVRPIFGGSLTQTQVDGCNAIVDAWNTYVAVDNRQALGYCLGTAKWESASTMAGVKETGNAKQPLPTDAMVISRLTRAWKAGKLPWVEKDYWSKGWFGRGLVQLTHEDNYSGIARQSVLTVFNVDILAAPDKALRLDIAAFILVRGMWEGWFTGKAIRDFIDDKDESDELDKAEMILGRKVVNGKDRANEIATLGLAFEAALTTKADAEKVPEPKPAPPFTLEPDDDLVFPKRPWLAAIIDFFLNLLTGK